MLISKPLTVRLATSDADLRAVLRLRGQCFRGAADEGIDQDRFDPAAQHIMVEDARGTCLCTARVTFWTGRDILQSYAAHSYGLSALAQRFTRFAELGRCCIAPQAHAAAVSRLSWGMLTQMLESHGTELLFGCPSFAGTDPALYDGAFAVLAAHHLAPAPWGVTRQAAEVFDLTGARTPPQPMGLNQIPGLLKTYLNMNGKVSDHAVIDRDLNTMHIFTGIEIAKIPTARVRLLRSLARDL